MNPSKGTSCFFVGVLCSVLLGFPGNLGSAPSRKEKFFTSRSVHYEILSDVDEELCRKAAARLEQAFQCFRTALPYQKSPHTRLKVRIFSTKEKFDEYNQSVHRAKDPHRSFVYHHYERESAKCEVVAFVKSEAELMAGLQHEAFHQYFRSIIDYPPQWVNEGLAEYFEVVVIDENRRFVSRPAPWLQKWRTEKKRLGSNTTVLIPVKDLMSFSKEEWEEQSNSYCESWALVYFFLHSDHAEWKKRFTAYLAALKSGSPREDNTRLAMKAAFTGANFEELERLLVEFMEGL